MKTMICSKEGFSAQEEMAHYEAAQVRELDLKELVGVACAAFPTDKTNNVYHWKDACSMDNTNYIVIDRRKLGSKSSRRFQVIKPNYNQDIIGLCRSLKEVQELIHSSGVIYR